jgi:hypothetical protein
MYAVAQTVLKDDPDAPEMPAEPNQEQQQKEQQQVTYEQSLGTECFAAR